MIPVLLYFSLACLLSASYRSSVTDATCVPTDPIAVDVDLEASLGVWYTYLNGPGMPFGNQSNKNTMSTYHKLGYVSGTLNKMAQALEIQQIQGNATECSYFYAQNNRTSCGLDQQKSWGFVGGALVISYDEKWTVYSDPDFIQIWLICANIGCTSHFYRVQIRKLPSTLTVNEIAAINSIVDMTLAPYCHSYTDLNLVHTSPSPACNYQNRPVEYIDEVTYIRKKCKTECQLERTRHGRD